MRICRSRTLWTTNQLRRSNSLRQPRPGPHRPQRYPDPDRRACGHRSRCGRGRCLLGPCTLLRTHRYHTPATPTTTDHAVNAGNVVWAFDLPQPTVTHTPAPGTSGYIAGNVLVDTRASGVASTLDLPAHNSGDQLIILVGHTYQLSPVAQILPPTGWTVVLEGEAGSTSAVGLAAWSKVGDGSESTATIPAIPALVQNTVVAIAIAVGGVNSIESVALTMQETGTDIDSPSITPSALSAILRAFVFDDDQASADGLRQ